MFDYLFLPTLVIVGYSLALLVTTVTTVVLEHLYCKCKPSYRFTDYMPTNVVATLLFPLVLPLLLIELIYISFYCLTKNLKY